MATLCRRRAVVFPLYLLSLLLGVSACSAAPLEVPLGVDGARVVDASGANVRLACVNWFGAEQLDGSPSGLHIQDPKTIAETVSRLGFNCVRLPFSVQNVLTDPTLDARTVKAATEKGYKIRTSMDALDAAVSALSDAGVGVLLDNHMSDAGWCCNLVDDNGLWYNERWPEEAWVEAWVKLAARYRSTPLVFGADLRNEPRETRVKAAHGTPHACRVVDEPWGAWRDAFERCGRAIRAVNPEMLLVVEATGFSVTLPVHEIISGSGAVRLDRVVYSPHDYAWENPKNLSNLTYPAFEALLDKRWGVIATEGKYPILLGEFGASQVEKEHSRDTSYWRHMMLYLAKREEVGFALWSLDSSGANGDGKTPQWCKPPCCDKSGGSGHPHGEFQDWGLLNASYTGAANEAMARDLQNLMYRLKLAAMAV